MEVDPSAAPTEQNELSVGGESALLAPEVQAAAGGSPAPTLNDAMYLLAKLRDEKYYPKGGYSSDIGDEWKAMLDSHYGEVRPCF